MNSPRHDFLAGWIATSGASHTAFQNPAAGISAAASGTIVTPLDHLGLIRISGEDARDFLHKLGSNDVLSLPADQARYNSLNSPKGRVLASFLFWQADTEILLALSADLASAIARKLSMYVLRAKVKVTEANDRVLLGLSGSQAAAILSSLAGTIPGQMGVTTANGARIVHLDGERYLIESDATTAESLWNQLCAAGATPAHSAAWRWLDIQVGIPLVTARTQDEFVAQMINFELIGGVNFKKGCYPGQEIVARTQYLGKLKKRMFRAHVASDSAPAVGDDIYSPEFGEQSCGKLVAVEPSPAGGFDLLAVMQISAFESGTVRLGSASGIQLELGSLPYAID